MSADFSNAMNNTDFTSADAELIESILNKYSEDENFTQRLITFLEYGCHLSHAPTFFIEEILPTLHHYVSVSGPLKLADWFRPRPANVQWPISTFRLERLEVMLTLAAISKLPNFLDIRSQNPLFKIIFMEKDLQSWTTWWNTKEFLRDNKFTEDAIMLIARLDVSRDLSKTKPYFPPPKEIVSGPRFDWPINFIKIQGNVLLNLSQIKLKTENDNPIEFTIDLPFSPYFLCSDRELPRILSIYPTVQGTTRQLHHTNPFNPEKPIPFSVIQSPPSTTLAPALSLKK